MYYNKVFIWPQLAVFTLPKCGCTSIQKAIQSTGKTSKLVNKLQPGELDGKKCYVVTRHPHDRLVSFYLNKIVKGGRLEKDTYHEDFGFYIGMPFREMVEVICDTPDEESNRHFRSQTSLLCPNGKMLATHSWHFEQIDDFWRAVQKEVDVPDLGHNRKTRSRKHWKKYYTDETLKMVADRYRKDIDVFGYSV